MIVGHIIVEKNVYQQNMLLHQYLLMIPMYDMSNNIYMYIGTMKQGLELELNHFIRRVTNDIFSHIRQVTKWGFLSSVCSFKILLPNCKAQLRLDEFIFEKNSLFGIMFQTLYTFLFIHA